MLPLNKGFIIIGLQCDYFGSIVFTEAVLPQLLYALCAGPQTPLQHLEQQQVSSSHTSFSIPSLDLSCFVCMGGGGTGRLQEAGSGVTMGELGEIGQKFVTLCNILQCKKHTGVVATVGGIGIIINGECISCTYTWSGKRLSPSVPPHLLGKNSCWNRASFYITEKLHGMFQSILKKYFNCGWRINSQTGRRAGAGAVAPFTDGCEGFVSF